MKSNKLKRQDEGKAVVRVEYQKISLGGLMGGGEVEMEVELENQEKTRN